MRARVLQIVTVVVAATALLTGCVGSENGAAAPEVPPPADLCELAASAGAVSDAVSVQGAVGSPATVGFAAPLTIAATERTVAVEGAGEPIDATSLVTYATSFFDAASGTLTDTQGYDGAPTLPVPAANTGELLGCATVGSRVVVAVPGTETEPAGIRIFDVLSAQPARATGEQQQPVDGMPTVTATEAGAPVVSIPAADPPSETRTAVLVEGSGAVVAPGDSVMVHYASVRWSDNSLFDSSWAKGAPTVLVTTEVIDGYRQALEGQTVGSRVLAVIPPSAAYGEGEINEDDLLGETLVFVLDILAAVPTSAR